MRQSNLLHSPRDVTPNDAPVARPAADHPPEVCHACGGRRFWRSVHDAVVCAACHPPANPALVADWIDSGVEGPAEEKP